jgi:hypothetical protein
LKRVFIGSRDPNTLKPFWPFLALISGRTAGKICSSKLMVSWNEGSFREGGKMAPKTCFSSRLRPQNVVLLLLPEKNLVAALE